MFDKLQDGIKRRKYEKEKARLEKEAVQAAYEQERLRQEALEIQAERERLLSMDNKNLMVEMIFAVRGLYSQIQNIEEQQNALSDKMDDIQSDLSNLENDVSFLESKVNSMD